MQHDAFKIFVYELKGHLIVKVDSHLIEPCDIQVHKQRWYNYREQLKFSFHNRQCGILHKTVIT